MLELQNRFEFPHYLNYSIRSVPVEHQELQEISSIHAV